MAKKTMEFGYYPRKCDLAVGEISISTNSDLEKIVKEIEHSPNVHENWIYPPHYQMCDVVTGTITPRPYGPRVFGLRKTHTITHMNGDSDQHLHYLVWCLGFFTGMRLTGTEAGYLDATPICPGALTDFTPLQRELPDALNMVEEFWKRNAAKPRNAKLICGIIHTLFISHYSQALCYERFTHLYSALDACFALTKDLLGVAGRDPTHAARIAWMCDEFKMPTPAWALAAGPGSEVSIVRNNSVHESLFFDEPLGFAIYGGNPPVANRGNVTLEMQALVCRLLVALLGRPNCDYVRSVVTSRQNHGLYP